MIHPDLKTFRIALSDLQNAKDGLSSVHGVIEEYHNGHSSRVPINATECLQNLQREINRLKELEIFFSKA